MAEKARRIQRRLLPSFVLLIVWGCGDQSPKVSPDAGFEDVRADVEQEACGDGVCAPDETWESCPQDCVPCDGLSSEGCCDGSRASWCEEGTLRSRDCGADGCGWTDEAGYRCGGSGQDPSGEHVLSCGCDESKVEPVTRIYHGTTEPDSVCLTEGQKLAIGALGESDGVGSYTNYCTATLVAPTVVLTAAHCVASPWGGLREPSEMAFMVGRDLDHPEAVFDVAQLVIHAGYQGDADNDLGLVILRENALLTLPSLMPLAVNQRDLGQGFLGETVQNVGFGATDMDENNRRRYWTSEVVTEVNTAEYVVYGQHWSSVCFGDSGGPSLYAFDGEVVAVTGTVSWGDPSCMDYDHFCRVDANWTDFLEPYLGGQTGCGDLDEMGRCDGSVALWCEGGEVHQQCCEVECGQDFAGRYRCLDGDCGGIDEKGACLGSQLYWCADGVSHRRSCNVCGNGGCGWVDDTVGYDCLD